MTAPHNNDQIVDQVRHAFHAVRAPIGTFGLHHICQSSCFSQYKGYSRTGVSNLSPIMFVQQKEYFSFLRTVFNHVIALTFPFTTNPTIYDH